MKPAGSVHPSVPKPGKFVSVTNHGTRRMLTYGADTATYLCQIPQSQSEKGNKTVLLGTHNQISVASPLLATVPARSALLIPRLETTTDHC